MKIFGKLPLFFVLTICRNKRDLSNILNCIQLYIDAICHYVLYLSLDKLTAKGE